VLVWQRVGTAGLAAGVCAVLLAACSVKESSGKPDRGVGSLAKRQELLGAFADCALSEVQWFQQSAAALREAAMTHEATLSADSLTALRGAWESAEDRWQVLELFQFGPAAKSNMPGGQDLRDQIYVWPLFNRCLIEQIIVNKAFQPELFSRQPANARGLGGLEYVAFYAADDNACPTTNPINVNGTWQALVAEGRFRASGSRRSAQVRGYAGRRLGSRPGWFPRPAR
jgi:predicted lipoprotein